MNNYCVITTINFPTKAIEVLYEKFGKNLIIVGDEKTPENWNYKDVTYLNPKVESGWYEGYAPNNHYARKNLGYLEAIRNGAELIYDTDDDNIPNENWEIRNLVVNAKETVSEGWHNVYGAFTATLIWPRGFSLKKVKEYKGILSDSVKKISSIQQGISNGEPDVDAIWRLTRGKAMKFENNVSVYLKSNTWCPFNSQSTWFFKRVFPLLYLPVTATMRMTDIYRSYVAQKCLWTLGEGVTFHSPSEVFQDRNKHDLLKDFEDEIPGYLHNDKIVEILSNLKLKTGTENICDNMLTCYQAIVDKGILPEMEMRSLNLWIKDVKEIWKPL